MRTDETTSAACELAVCELVVTGICNIACDYCIATGLQKLSMTPPIGRKAIDLFFYLAKGCKYIDFVFTGGEPLTQLPLLNNLAEYTRSRAQDEGISPRFIVKTNGTLANKKIINFLQRFDSSVVVSIDGASFSHNAHRKSKLRAHTHDRVVKNLLTYIDSGIKCSASLTVHPDEAESVQKNVRYLYELGVNEISIAPVYGTVKWEPNQTSHLSTSLMEVASFIRGIHRDGGCVEVGPLYKHTQHINGGLLDVWGCEAASTTLAFLPDGSIVGCSALAMLTSQHPELLLGNVSDGLDQDAVDHTIKLARATDAERLECQSCQTSDNCAGGCLAFNFASTGTAFAPPKIYCSTISAIPEAWGQAWGYEE